jgi:hypothetical protein
MVVFVQLGILKDCNAFIHNYFNNIPHHSNYFINNLILCLEFVIFAYIINDKKMKHYVKYY